MGLPAKPPNGGTRIGRPTKCVPEVTSRILEGVRVGLPDYLACQRADIDHTTLYHWRDRAEQGEQPFFDFIQKLARTRAERALEVMQTADSLRKSADNDATRLKACEMLLRIIGSQDLSLSRHQVDVSGDIDVRMSIADLDPLLDAVRSAGLVIDVEGGVVERKSLPVARGPNGNGASGKSDDA